MHLLLPVLAHILIVLASAAPPSSGQKSGVAIPITRRRSGVVNPDGSVNFKALDAHVGEIRAKHRRVYDNYERNIRAMQISIPREVDKRANKIHLALTNGDYYGTITVGTTPKTFTVVFDTGSCDFFLPGATCDTCDGHTLWNPASSDTARGIGKPFYFDFSEGSVVEGEFYVDNVTLAGFTADRQIIGVATYYSEQFASPRSPADGLAGLAFRGASQYNVPSIFETLMAEGKVFHPVFSFKAAGPSPELYLGGIDSEYVDEDIVFVDVMSDAVWDVDMDNIQCAGQTFFSAIPAVIDTGASFIYGPPSDVKTMLTSVGGTPAPSDYRDGDGEYYTFPCDRFPNIFFSFGGNPFRLGEDASMGTLPSDPTICVCSIIGERGSSDWTLGISFLKSVYTVFDVGRRQVGFATLRSSDIISEGGDLYGVS